MLKGRITMKLRRPVCVLVSCLLLLLVVGGCSRKQPAVTDAQPAARSRENTPTTLPVRFQRPMYMAVSEHDDTGKSRKDVFKLKVGARITSTRGPQPLWDILRRLVRLKGMSVSWASDVDRNVLVDVNIRADDDFFAAIENLLRQVDYFMEVTGKTIVVKYKETKKFYISVPYMRGTYTTTVGGNFLANQDAANSTEATVKITSDENEFDVWSNIQNNLDIIMQKWATRTISPEKSNRAESAGNQRGKKQKQGSNEAEKIRVEPTRRIATGDAYYTIDKSIGLVTVTAPRPLLDKVASYLNSLKKELYRQVMIEAKIIEVYLKDNSKVGIDWSSVLKDFSISGTTFFGTSGFGAEAGTGLGGQVYPWIPAVGDADSVTTFVSKITLNPVDFTVMLNALNEQGETRVLSNPKITVLNGQPALISVGKDTAYIKTVTKNVDTGTGNTATITYTADVDHVVEGVSLGVVASIVDDNSVLLHLTPVTTELENKEIPYKRFGDQGLEVGLPKVRIREMSSMVEVKNGEMLIIGGLIDQVDGTSGNFAPIVGDIPLVKYLFGVEQKIKEKRELVILLIPKII